MDTAEFIHQLSIVFIPGLLAITLHEVAHGWAALYFGDPTAMYLGRLSLNPIKHIDPVGTVAVPLTLLFLNASFLFGWANPVPINSRNLNNPRIQLALIAVAGPLANAVMAMLWAGVIKLALLANNAGIIPAAPGLFWLIRTAEFGILINIVLGVFNLLPVPPLDGGKIIMLFIPYKISQILYEYENIGFIILLFLLMSGLLSAIISPVIYLFHHKIHILFGLKNTYIL